MPGSDPTAPRVFLVGLGSTTQTALDGLAARFEVCGLLRPGEDAVVKQARSAGILVHDRGTLEALTRAVTEADPDVVVVSSYDRILPASLVSRLPFVNVHYAPLPRYRGRATVNWAVLNGEASTAITIHCLEPDLDAGGVLAQENVPIGPRTTTGELYDQLNAAQERLLADAVARRLRGDRGTAQDESRATYACTRVPDDGEIHWADPTLGIDRLVRSLDGPFPSAFTFLGSQRVLVHQAHPVNDPPTYDGRVPGRVVRVDRTLGHVDVLTGDGVLRVTAVSDGSGEVVRAAEVITSVRQTLVSRLAARVAELEQQLADLRKSCDPRDEEEATS